jgi:microcompartment protein CcmK/EutM
MRVAKVIGPVVATVKHRDYIGKKLFLVQGVSPSEPEEFLAVDVVQAGVGDIVLTVSEGNSARQIMKVPLDGRLAIRSVIVGIIDEINLEYKE